MPRFEPFRALRYRTTSDTDISSFSAPPYDVFDEATRQEYASANNRNIVLIDYPIESDGPSRYDIAARRLEEWKTENTICLDDDPSLSIYRMTFIDDIGTQRTTCGVIGALEVVDEGAPGVLPHERTTPKAKTDRLDLTRATTTNMSPVWGLSLAQGLTDSLLTAGHIVATCVDEQGVKHQIERVTDSERIAVITSIISAHPVLIADGHHRYAISRTYRDEQRTSGHLSDAELTMTYVAELVQEQLSVAAIHRLYSLSSQELIKALSPHYDIAPAGQVGNKTLQLMQEKNALCLVDKNGEGTFLIPRNETFDEIRDMDSARLEHALANTPHEVSYQHGVHQVINAVATSTVGCAVLIRPVSLAEIRRTADTGELMPPKSTFFTPKLRTGLVMRPLLH